MHYPDEEESLHQQTTIPAHPPASLSGQTAAVPVWPPPPRPRAPQGLSRRMKILIFSLATVLILGGFALLILSTTNQYNQALSGRSSSNLTATARSQATLASRQRATAAPLETANAQIYATATAQGAPAATASAAGGASTATAQTMAALLTKATSGTPTLNDPLSSNNLGNAWDVGYTDNNNTGCNFVNGSYQVLEAQPGQLRLCFADNTNFSKFAYQVSMTFNTSCAGGMLLRGNPNTGQYYLFTINTDGSYMFEVYNRSNYIELASGSSAAIESTSGQTNTLAVVADQGVFDLFINQTYVATAIDGELSTGLIGVVAYNTGLPASANFSNAEVWQL